MLDSTEADIGDKTLIASKKFNDGGRKCAIPKAYFIELFQVIVCDFSNSAFFFSVPTTIDEFILRLSLSNFSDDNTDAPLSAT